MSNGLLEDNAESVAQFLHKGEGLNKTAIGDYLGERYFCYLHDYFYDIQLATNDHMYWLIFFSFRVIPCILFSFQAMLAFFFLSQCQ